MAQLLIPRAVRKVKVPNHGGADMGIKDKFENKAEELKGRAKESAGAATGDADLENEGKADQVSSGVKKAAETVKDKANEIAAKIAGDN